jgi:hypothetical protein
MTRTEAMADIAKRFPAIPRSQAEKHWRKSDKFLSMMNRRYESGTAGRVLFDVAAEAPDATGRKRDGTPSTGISRYNGWR